MLILQCVQALELSGLLVTTQATGYDYKHKCRIVTLVVYDDAILARQPWNVPTSSPPTGLLDYSLNRLNSL